MRQQRDDVSEKKESDRALSISGPTPIGQVGNSGPSAWARLHLSLIRGRDLNASLPLALGPVRVSLNPTADDYWVREETSWPIREGYFVTTARP